MRPFIVDRPVSAALSLGSWPCLAPLRLSSISPPAPDVCPSVCPALEWMTPSPDATFRPTESLYKCFRKGKKLNKTEIPIIKKLNKKHG